MPTPLRTRRFKPLLTIVVLIVLTVLYLTSSARSTQQSEFYQRTQDALSQQDDTNVAGAGTAGEAVGSDANVAARLREAEEQAKAAADKKGDEHRAALGMEEIPDEKSGAGRKGVVFDDEEEDGMYPYAAEDAEDHALAPAAKDQVPVKGKEQTAETQEEHKVEEELNSILKRSPIIIFSKTYCPYSKKAKRILLEDYKITPAPYVVELDEHPLGPELQAALATSTGRRTVPNVLINGKSIGGGDDVQALHDQGTLTDTVKTMGGKRIMEASLVEKVATGDEVKRRRVKR
ncbi:hypothetical protein NA57DRAFT_71851 [Rhizodiscina lignyota]|uniref:Glutaredoxin domain-containing protein n=1 Tax=Rhizodiscina lignyota TaxID=1504668 RepID=A0A9P4M9M7_9PEZI|nr:hypothetical protein NA57DRAFT_71851 [Rhizodiscina lignyota]